MISNIASQSAAPKSFRYKALLWDIDGTLINTTQLILAALDHTYRTFLNRTLPDEQIRGIIGIPLAEQIRVFGEPNDFGVSPEAMISEFIQFYEANGHMEQIIAGAVECLISVKRRGVPTALVTSKNLKEIGNTLPRLGIMGFVDAIVSADDVSRPKPDPESVVLALFKLDAAPRDALFIGDTVHDMRAGASAGVKRCAVTWGAATRDKLLLESPEFICDDPADLHAVLGI